MKSLLFSILLWSFAVAAFAADAPSLNGKWQIYINVAGNESNLSCTFTQKDADLTGTCTGQNGEVNISGKVDGKNVRWVQKSEYQGSPLTLTFKGSTEGDKMGGTLTVEEFGVEGEFSATKAA